MLPSAIAGTSGAEGGRRGTWPAQARPFARMFLHPNLTQSEMLIFRRWLSHTVRAPGGWLREAAGTVGVAVLSVALIAPTASAQTDYYNTDAGRPIRVEDAYALERRGFELQAAPLRLERNRGGVYRWGIEPEIAYGILPRTQLEVGFPLAFVESGLGSRRTSGLAGIDISVLHNLNAETRLPALAIAAQVLVPAGNLGPDRAYPSVTGIATKTFPWARFHVNGQYTFGDAPGVATSTVVGAQVVEVSRWLGGIAVDRTLPLRSLLLTGEVYAEGGLADDSDPEWNAGVGTRYQLSPRLAMDAGLGRRLSGTDRTWYLTAGGAFAFGLPWSR